MNSLRARIALTLALAMVSVVAMSTAATLYFTRGFEERKVLAQLVDQIRLTAPLAVVEEGRPASGLSPVPAPGERDDLLSVRLRDLLREGGLNFDVRVIQATAKNNAMASVNYGAGWLTFPIYARRPSPGARMAFTGWVCLITIGTVLVALFIANRLTRQLAFLQDIATTIGSDGYLPKLPECGPAEVRATARALNTMGASLKLAVESRMRLVAAAGHDLRTPLTRMRLRAEFLGAEDRTPWLNDIDELEKIADSAIQFIREETNGRKTEHVRIDQVLSEICDELKSMNFVVVSGEFAAATISSSRLAITRALRNLIINAATHGGKAHVKVEVLSNDVVVVIEDEGPGIPEEFMPRIFEPFFRVDLARRKSVPGAGLGLAIAKEILERQGGNLAIRNLTPSGLRQEVTFAAA